MSEPQIGVDKEERKIALRDPMLLVFLGLILLLVPTAIGLVHLYEEAQERHAYRDLPPVPSLEVLTGVVREYHSELIDPQLEVAYLATPQPRSDLLVLYEVRDSNRLVYHLAVVRHDIACNTCRDLLVGIFLTPEEDRILGIASLEPWELAGGVVDPTPLLAQLKGRSLQDSLRAGRDLDGMTGASLSVQALLTELWGLGKRIARSSD